MHRKPVFDTELLDCEVDLTVNLLAVVVRGGLVLLRGGVEHYLRQGEAALVTPGHLTITEIPATGCGGAEYYYLLFHDECLRRSLNPDSIQTLERLVLPMKPHLSHIFPIPDFLSRLMPVMETVKAPFPQDFVTVLRLACNQMPVGAGSFLKRYFERRRALHHYLEQWAAPHRSLRGIGADYPGGEASFKQEFRAHYAGSVANWIWRRRMQLAYLALQFGKEPSAAQLANAFNSSESAFRRSFYRAHCLRPEDVPRRAYSDISPEHFVQRIAPLWHWAYSPVWKSIDQARACMLTHAVTQERRPRRRRREDLENTALFPAPAMSLPRAESKPDAKPNEELFGEVDFKKFVQFENRLDPFERPGVAQPRAEAA